MLRNLISLLKISLKQSLFSLFNWCLKQNASILCLWSSHLVHLLLFVTLKFTPKCSIKWKNVRERHQKHAFIFLNLNLPHNLCCFALSQILKQKKHKFLNYFRLNWDSSLLPWLEMQLFLCNSYSEYFYIQRHIIRENGC